MQGKWEIGENENLDADWKINGNV